MLFLKTACVSGKRIDEALSTLIPPLFFRDIPLCRDVLPLWSLSDLEQALLIVGELEIELKRHSPFWFAKLSKFFS